MKSIEKNFVTTVIYVRNVEKQIKAFLQMVVEVMESNFEHSEIICVNDFSEDHSLDKIKEVSVSAKTTNITVVNMSYYHGLELAMNAGVDLAIGDFIFEFDDVYFDFNKDVIMQVYRHCLKGFDIVIASPDQKEKITSRLFYTFFARFSVRSYVMNTQRFCILSRRAMNRIQAMNKTIPYRKAVYANCGLKIDQLKYSVAMNASKSSHTRDNRYRIHLAIESLILFTEFGYRFSMIMTTIMIVLSILMAVYAIIAYFVLYPVEGWTTTILFVSVVFSGLFGILTIIIKYLQLLVDLNFKRKYYSFESIEKMTTGKSVSEGVKSRL